MRVAKLKATLQTSLWAAPTLGAAAALLLAGVAIAVDHRRSGPRTAWYEFDGGPDAAQHLLSVITASMLTFTALVFSITVLVLQLASTQFSPRVIRTFLQAPTTKWTMAAFVGTFVYGIAVLSRVRVGPPAFVPGLATWLGLVLVLGSIGVFIHYIHRMAHSVRVISLITSVAEETRHGIDELYPDAIGVDPPPGGVVPARPPAQLVFHAGEPGVITAVAASELYELACRRDALIEVTHAIGDFVPTGALVFRVWDQTVEPSDLTSRLTLERERTPNQDPGFGFRQLVDIGLRALSPGINDPTTAVQAIDQLHDLVRRLTQRAFPSAARADATGRVRVIAARPAYADYVTVAFEEMAQYGASSTQVIRRLRAALDDCIAIAAPDRRAVLAACRAALPPLGRRPSSGGG